MLCSMAFSLVIWRERSPSISGRRPMTRPGAGCCSPTALAGKEIKCGRALSLPHEAVLPAAGVAGLPSILSRCSQVIALLVQGQRPHFRYHHLEAVGGNSLGPWRQTALRCRRRGYGRVRAPPCSPDKQDSRPRSCGVNPVRLACVGRLVNITGDGFQYVNPQAPGRRSPVLGRRGLLNRR